MKLSILVCRGRSISIGIVFRILVVCIAVLGIGRRFHCRYHESGYHWVCRSLRRKGHDVISVLLSGTVGLGIGFPDSLRLSPYRPCFLFRLDCAPESGVIFLGSDRRNRK